MFRPTNDFFDSALIWDDHGGFEMLPGKPLQPMLQPWYDAGVNYVSINVGYDKYLPIDVLNSIAWVRRRIAEDAPFARLVHTVDEIETAFADGKLAVTFDVEGMNALCESTEMVSLYYDLGVRHMNFAYNRNNAAGSGCHDEDTGLTAFGRNVVTEMNRVGMVVDCSHCGYLTTMQAMEQSSAPVIFSHSNPRALHDHGRNVTDDQIRACAETGGVIGINGVNTFLGVEVASALDVAKAVIHVIELTSTDHVGLCLDYAPEFDQPNEIGNQMSELIEDTHFWPENAGYSPNIHCLHVDQTKRIALELAALGCDAEDLKKILGLNFRRVAQQVWKPPSVG